jgi:ABC-type glycerol-3-phosphate transport system substrate-binding protein
MVSKDFLAQHSWFQTMVDAVPHAESLAPVGHEKVAPQIQDSVTKHYQQMLLTDSTPAKSADALQQDLTKILDGS